jgi:DNA repair exonuclease SbcCD ATPase subunit
MINRITYSVVFPTTGASLKGEFKPQPGITAVIGPNESGKTFTTIELTRYLLFGKPALRGPAIHYKKLEASGEFIIRGHTYTVSRSAKKETVVDAVGNVLAVGAEEVTNKMVQLLGYGLSVFDITNASVQKKADMFGELRPAERKKLIDQVVGLADQEKVEKALKDEGAALAREAEALTRQLLAPTKPVKPKGYLPSEKLKDELDEAEKIVRSADAIKARIRDVDYPVEPETARPRETREQLDEMQRIYTQIKSDFDRYDRIVQNAVTPEYTEEQLDAAAERLTLKSLVENQVTCPKCGEEFVPGHGHLELPDGPDLTRMQISQARDDLHQAGLVAEAKQKRSSLRVTLNVTEDVTPQLAVLSEWETYDRLFAMAVSREAQNKQAQEELAEISDIPSSEEITYLRERVRESQFYEHDLGRYAKDKARFDELTKEISELERRSKAFKDGAKNLMEARSSVKAYLAPAISAAASNLMHHMTSGKHSSITVDEDLEITVGTQPLDTLSGGAATVANLALRFALGQVLVSETFPVFLGDEMDSDADESRRETVADALQSLVQKGLLKQVILVTHRGIDIADHVRDLGITE